MKKAFLSISSPVSRSLNPLTFCFAKKKRTTKNILKDIVQAVQQSIKQKVQETRRVPEAERERGKLEDSGLRRRELGGRHKLLYAISLLKISTYEGGSTGSDTKKITKKRLMTAGAWSRTWGATHKTQPKKAAYEGGSLGGATYCSTRYLSSKLAARHVPSRSRTSTYINIVKHVSG